jgi:hypothetical protein
MASVPETCSSRFDPRHKILGDNLFRLVVPRAPEARPHIDTLGGRNLRDKRRAGDLVSICTDEEHSPLLPSATSPSKPPSRSNSPEATPVLSPAQPRRTACLQTAKKATRNSRGLSRREQCKANQARYRVRQRYRHEHTEASVQQLREDVERLKRGYESIRPDGKPKRNPWAIVSEVLRLVGDTVQSPWQMLEADDPRHTLREHVSPDVSMGDLCGVDAMMEQLRRYALNFGEPELQLQRIEAIAPDIMVATAALRATVTELTLRNVFPNLLRRGRQGTEDDHQVLRECLLGQRLHLTCSMVFLFDEVDGRVARLELHTDLVPCLLHMLGSVEDVANALLSLNRSRTPRTSSSI